MLAAQASTVLTSTENVQTSAATGLTFGTLSSATPSITGFNIGGTTTTVTTTTTPTFTFGGATTTTPTATGMFQGATKTSTIQTGFTLTPFTTAGFGITNTSATTTAAGFSLDTATTTSAIPIFTFGTTASSTAGFMLNKTTSVTASSSIATVTTHTTLGTTTTVSSSANAVQPGAINFCQLEESINKWTLELEEQEKVFVNQATQVNVWDKLLINNGEKIVTLNQEVERVKLEQQQLKHELDYVVGQQKELQDCLVPLEKELASLSVSDPEREYTYRLAESIDTQLKQMSEDLKEIIEHLNEANRIQDSSDPIVQISKILNAHMNSLQWLDQRTALLTQKIQQIDQMHQNFRQENERSFNLAYN
ncbi:nuclear pore glycoprotein p62 [Polistes fuscatus]|uniref:nuclear pore glycoprotein p62 n=1 Tax=Polistes fuscatus TaxID=30207 RepID=UPI001CA7F12F|nr:nuclear pore glycoprotein p62 [Polistes fuscatus]